MCCFTMTTAPSLQMLQLQTHSLEACVTDCDESEWAVETVTKMDEALGNIMYDIDLMRYTKMSKKERDAKLKQIWNTLNDIREIL